MLLTSVPEMKLMLKSLPAESGSHSQRPTAPGLVAEIELPPPIVRERTWLVSAAV